MRQGRDNRAGEGTPETGARDRLLMAAADLFAKHGYAGTSVREVCAAAGVTKPTLYYYFDSKAGLAKALFEEAAGDVLKDLRRLADGPGALREKLYIMARLMFERSSAAPETCRFFYASMFAPRAEAEGEFADVIAQIVALTEVVFDEAQRTGEASDIDPELAAMLFLGALQGYACRFVRAGDVDLTPALAKEIVDGVLDGLADGSRRRRKA